MLGAKNIVNGRGGNISQGKLYTSYIIGSIKEQEKPHQKVDS